MLDDDPSFHVNLPDHNLRSVLIIFFGGFSILFFYYACFDPPPFAFLPMHAMLLIRIPFKWGIGNGDLLLDQQLCTWCNNCLGGYQTKAKSRHGIQKENLPAFWTPLQYKGNRCLDLIVFCFLISLTFISAIARAGHGEFRSGPPLFFLA
jgi:hypothetical protein